MRDLILYLLRHRAWKAVRAQSPNLEYHCSQGMHFCALLSNISWLYYNIQTVADVIRTCLGPKAMLKMILDPMGGILYVHMTRPYAFHVSLTAEIYFFTVSPTMEMLSFVKSMLHTLQQRTWLSLVGRRMKNVVMELLVSSSLVRATIPKQDKHSNAKYF